MNFFEALKKADAIIDIIAKLILAIESLKQSNEKLETKVSDLSAKVEGNKNV